MTTLNFTIPSGLWLHSNDRRHWADKARATRALRLLGKTTAQQEKVRDLPPCHVAAHIGYPTGRKADASNALPTVKALIDGLVDAEVWPDDDDNWVVSTAFARDANHGLKNIHTVRLELTEAA